jgi:hypothetical protein
MRLISTKFATALLATGALLVSSVLHSEVIFEENFDDQPDWHSGMVGAGSAHFASTSTLPDNWFAIRQDPTWAPSTGHPDRHESIEILASNSDKARGGKGKSSVHYRDHTQTPGYWASDSILAKYFPEGYDEIYVEFYIRFQPGWTPEGKAKIFRVSSWSGEPDFFGYGGNKENGPTFFLDYWTSSGTRNYMAFRAGPHGEGYGMSNSDIDDLPRSLVYIGDFSGNWTSNTVGSTYGPDPQIPDKLNGGFISKDINYFPSHEQIYGPAGTWTKYGFYFKMNSAPGVKDGVFKQWFDDQLVLESNAVRWVKANAGNKMVKWNVVAFGGNNDWDTSTYRPEDRRQEWYSIDDIVIRTEIPDYVGSAIAAPPNPPSDIGVQ